MSKMQGKSTKWLIEKAEEYRKAIANCTDESRKATFVAVVEKIQAEIKSRSEQKKTKSQPTTKTEQLEETEKIKRAVLNPSIGIPNAYDIREMKAQNQHADAIQSEQAFSIQENRVVVGRASDVVVTVPVAEVLVGGKLRVLTQTEILGLLKTYFKGVATGAKMQEGKYSEAYGGEMGKTVYRLFDAWNLIYQQSQEGEAWPPKSECFPGLKNAKQDHKACVDVLYRWASRKND